MLINFFEAGLELVKRLETMQFNGDTLFKKVALLQSLNDVTENKQITPSACVVYMGHTVLDTTGNGEKVKFKQQYAVIFAVANAQSQMDAIAMLENAGVFIPDILKQINGWQATPNLKPFKAVGSDRAGFSNSFSYFPFTFETILTI